MTERDTSSSELWSHFRERVPALAGRVAVATPAGDLTFGSLAREAEETATAFTAAGVREGSVVALALPNCPEFLVAFLALCRLSAAVALVSPLYGESELQSIAAAIRPDCFVTRPAHASRFLGRLGRSATVDAPVRQVNGSLALIFQAGAPAWPLPPGAGHMASLARIALLKFTSGSTGEPKGIALTAHQVLTEARNVVDTLAVTPEDRILAPVPVFHSYGFDLGVLPALSAGATLVLHDPFVPRRLLSDLSTKSITLLLGVPSMYVVLLETRVTEPPSWKRTRYLLSCTAPMSPETIASFSKKYGMPICQHYGSSETGAVTTHVPSEVLGRPGSVGVPMRNVEVKILGEGGEELKHGEVGEVVVRSAAIAEGYVMGAPPGPSPFSGGAYRTGDLGTTDAQGFLYLSGRKDRIINVGGFKVSPEEVRQVLERFPAVREAVVLGVKDSSGEEVVYAVVTLRRAASEEEMLRYCQERLAEYKVPRRIEIRDELPRGPSGKVVLRPDDVRS